MWKISEFYREKIKKKNELETEKKKECHKKKRKIERVIIIKIVERERKRQIEKNRKEKIDRSHTEKNAGQCECT